MWTFNKPNFLLKTDGSIAVNFSIALTAVVIAVGAAVDYSSMVKQRTYLQDWADSIALAAVRSGFSKENELQIFAEDFIKSSELPDTKVDLSLGAGTLSVDLSREKELFIMGAFGGEKTKQIGASSAVPMGMGGNVNLALVLDTTQSMGGTRLNALKTAANDLLDTFGDDENSGMVSLVPFSDYVRISTDNAGQPWIDVPEPEAKSGKYIDYDQSVNCVVTFVDERRTVTCDEYVWVDFQTQQSWLGCMNSRRDGYHKVADFEGRRLQGLVNGGFCRPATHNELVPLTSDIASLKAAVNDLTVRKETYIPAGLVWGWRTLSPNAPFSESLQNPDASNVMILMSDGSNNISLEPNNSSDGGLYHFGNGDRQVRKADADKLTAELCASIKQDGIEIFTVAFEIEETSTLAMMKDCASSSGHFYNADDSTSLKTAFASIGEKFTDQLRLLK